MSPERPSNRQSSRSGNVGKVSPKDIALVLAESLPDPSAKKTYLSRDEARALVQRAKAGDAEAWNQLLIYYAGMLRYTTEKAKLPDTDLKGAIAEGLLALQAAVSKYPSRDPEHFTAYARRWVERGVRRFARTLRRETSDG